jgi:hypothetical protein
MTKKPSLSGGQFKTPQPMTDGGGIDLARLRDMHPLLPADMAGVMVMRAALGLQRNRHSSGVGLQMAIENRRHYCALIWPAADLGAAKQHDDKRITEDGAEAIALAVAYRTRAWRVVRRMQQGEHADWLLEDQDKGVRKLVAFEVGGTDQRSITGPLRDKLVQVAKSVDVDQRWAGVVGFKKPETALHSVEVRTHGR